MENGSKPCKKCGVIQPASEFYQRSASAGGTPHTWCKSCFRQNKRENYYRNHEKQKARLREWHSSHREEVKARRTARRLADPEAYRRKRWEARIKKKYGMKPAEYWAMSDAQGGVCWICQRPPRDDKPLGVDHDHVTGAVRGLLCDNCNGALGFFDDNPALIGRAIDYLKRAAKG